MSLSKLIRKYLFIASVLFCLGAVACQGAGVSTEGELAAEVAGDRAAAEGELLMREYIGERSLEILYPSAWVFHLPKTGILMFAREETIELAEPGPLLTVLRISTAQVHGNAEGELNHFLDFGPLREGYTLEGEYEQLLIDGQEAWAASLSFAGDEETEPMEAYIVSSESGSGAVYIFASTAPAEIWETYETTFRVMVSSVRFTE